MKRKFYIISEYCELLDLALHLQKDNEVLMWIPSESEHDIGEGLIKKEKEWYKYVGKGYIWIFDGCSRGVMQDFLRSKGEAVIGGTKEGDDLENDRQLNQKWFKELGFQQVFSKNFKDFESALKFIQTNAHKKWILKQNGNAPKSLNYKGKFDGSIDMIYHLEDLKKKWNEAEYGKIDFDLMEIVEGLECAASAFFNGQDFLRKDGKIVGFLNFEEKKECNDGMGETTGETGTTFVGVTEEDPLFKSILLRPGIKEKLRKMNFRGVFDINCIVAGEKIVALEPTMRFGIPSTSYEFIEGINNCAEVLEAMAKGLPKQVNINLGVGMVIVLTAKPYPLEDGIEDDQTSIGEKLWILDKGKPIKDFTEEQKKHIHLYNFKKEEDYLVATKSGYLLTVTMKGEKISTLQKDLQKYIKDNLYISGQKHRTDIGSRLIDNFKK